MNISAESKICLNPPQETNCKNFLKMILLLLDVNELMTFKVLRVGYHRCNKESVDVSCDAQVANWRSQNHWSHC